MNLNFLILFDKMFEILFIVYDLLFDWGLQRQILLVFVNNFIFKEMSICILNLIKYRYIVVRKYVLEKG